MYYKHEQDGQRSITIRLARSEDAPALVRLAERDSTVVPAGEMLVAFAGEEMRAAIAVSSDAIVSDPFHPTAELARLLRTRARQLRGGGTPAPRRRFARLLKTRPAGSMQPAGTLRPRA